MKAAHSSNADSFGWYGSIIDVSKDKVFDRNIVGESSIKAVENSCIWDFFLYLSKKRAENDFKNSLE